MKKLTTIALLFLMLSSCSESKENLMLQNYLNKDYKKKLNIEIKELDLKITEVKKISSIKSSDSADFYKKQLADLVWDNEASNKKDTLTFDGAIGYFKELHEGYQEVILGNIKLRRSYKNPRLKRLRDDFIKKRAEAVKYKIGYSIYSKNLDSVLSYKYSASYSIYNPALKVRQTYDKVLFSNSNDSKFVRTE